MTVKELIDQLKMYPDDYPIKFSDGIEFYRLKDRGGLVQMEFDVTIYMDSDTDRYVLVQ